MRFDDPDTDLNEFLSALESTVSPPLKPLPSIERVVRYTLGWLDPTESLDIERCALTDQVMRQRLVAIASVVERFQRETSQRSEAVSNDDAFQAEITLAYRRITVPNDLSMPPFDQIRIVGREKEIGQLLAWISGVGGPLVFVSGPGGIGKTFLMRKMRELAGEIVPNRYAISCGTLTTVDDFYSEIAHEMGVELGQDVRDDVLRGLDSAPSLLFCDNVDRLSIFSQEIKVMLERAPRLRVMATSRVAVSSEISDELALQPLSLSGADLGESEAAGLFRQVTQGIAQVQPHSTTTTTLIQELCRFTRGVPLSLAILAGCLAVVDLPRLVDQVRGDSVSPVRRAGDSVQFAVDHTLLLLARVDRDVLQAVAVFAGHFKFEDAQFVTGITDAALSKSLVQLCKCSLVSTSIERDVTRYQVHDAVLDALDVRKTSALLPVEVLLAVHRHGALFASAADQIGDLVDEGKWGSAVTAFVDNHSNLRRAVRHSIDHSELALIRRFANGLARICLECGYLDDFETISGAAYAASRALMDPALRARVLGLEGALLARKSDSAGCRSRWMERLELSRQLRDIEQTADALTDLAWDSYESGAFELALKYLDEGEELARQASRVDLIATVQVIRARFAIRSNQREDALAWLSMALLATKQAGKRQGVLFVYQNLVVASEDLDLRAQATDLAVELLSLSFEIQSTIHIGWALRRLAKGLSHTHPDLALQCLVAATQVFREYRTKHRAAALKDLQELVESGGSDLRDRAKLLAEGTWEEAVQDILGDLKATRS